MQLLERVFCFALSIYFKTGVGNSLNVCSVFFLSIYFKTGVGNSLNVCSVLCYQFILRLV